MQDSLHERGQAMENLFFAEQDKKLLDKLREEMDSRESREALAAASGITEATVIDALAKSGITPESLTSVALIPLVAVAWSDNVMDANEKKAILKAAAIAGIDAGSASYQTIESWLTIRPPMELLDSWKGYVGTLKTSLDAVAFNQLKASVIDRAEDVAKSAGGFLGIGDKVSNSERKVLDELAAAFD